MKLAVAFIIGCSTLAVGCASVQETTMFRGPFGRTQIASTVLAADPASDKILVQTTDGVLRVFRVTPAASPALSGFRVGDDVLLTFDDRASGDAVIGLTALTLSADNMPLGVVPRFALPARVRVGAPLVGGTFVAGVAGDPSPTTIVAAEGTVAAGVVPVGGGVLVPGFAGIGTVQPGALTPAQAAGLGLGPSSGVVLGPGVLTTGNLTPGTVAPGVTTLNTAGGKPSIQGPFTPGTVAPGVTVSAGTGNKPAIQGSFTPGTVAPGVTSTSGTTGSAGSSQGLTIRTPGAAPPVPDSAAVTTGTTTPAGGISIPGMTGTGAPLTGSSAGNRDAATAPPTGTTATPTRDAGAVRQSPGSSAQPATSGRGVGATAPTRGSTTTPTGTSVAPSSPIGSQR